MNTISPLPLAPAILGALGPGYSQTFEPMRREDDPPSINLRVRTPDGAEFIIQATGYGHPQHFRIHGDYVFSKTHGTFYPKGAPTIQVSATKSPAQIAKDIQRRFIPDFLSAWDESRTRAQAAEEAHAAKIKTYLTLCEILGETPKDPHFFHNSDFVIHLYDTDARCTATIRVTSADSVRFDVSADADAGFELTKSIASLFATRHTLRRQAGAAGS